MVPLPFAQPIQTSLRGPQGSQFADPASRLHLSTRWCRGFAYDTASSSALAAIAKGSGHTLPFPRLEPSLQKRLGESQKPFAIVGVANSNYYCGFFVAVAGTLWFVACAALAAACSAAVGLTFITQLVSVSLPPPPVGVMMEAR